MGSSTFCFCLPVRFGAFVMSGGQALWSGITAAILWLVFLKIHHLPPKIKLGIEIAMIIMTVLTAISFVGMIGTLTRSRRMLKPFVAWMWFQLVIYITSTVFVLVILYADRKEVTKLCNLALKDQSDRDDCVQSMASIDSTKTKVTMGFDTAVMLWMHSYGIVILRRFLRDLEEEEYEKLPRMEKYPSTDYKYDPPVVPY